MKRKRCIAYLLLMVSMLMLGVPVIPHHHHDNGMLCMKSDIETACNSSMNQESPTGKEHCCCQTGCVTTHFFQQMPTVDTTWAHPADHGWACFLSSLPPLPLDLSVPCAWRRNHSHYYIESLHDTFITRATGLRAPPSTLL